MRISASSTNAKNEKFPLLRCYILNPVIPFVTPICVTTFCDSLYCPWLYTHTHTHTHTHTPTSSCNVGNTAEAFWRSRPLELGQVQRPYQGHVMCRVYKGRDGGGIHSHVIYCCCCVYVCGSFILVLLVWIGGVGRGQYTDSEVYSWCTVSADAVTLRIMRVMPCILRCFMYDSDIRTRGPNAVRTTSAFL
jgi:hypothetical protein